MNGEYEPWRSQVPELVCPSMPTSLRGKAIAVTPMVFSVGDNVLNVASGPTRGLFRSFSENAHSDVKDGTSNTYAMIELRTYDQIVQWYPKRSFIQLQEYTLNILNQRSHQNLAALILRSMGEGRDVE